MSLLLGIDIGGSGSRIALRDTAAGTVARWESTDRAAVTAAGSSVPDAALGLVRAAAATWPDRIGDVDAIGLGATGLATLVDRPMDLALALRRELGSAQAETDAATPDVAVAIDAVTAHLGALGGEPGAIVALGTGAIALGTDGEEVWRRVDGWGHLLGDRGGGAWIGIRGLDAAVRAHDGVDDAGAALLAAARERFGDPLTWPAQLYTRPDRAGVLAGFAIDVAGLAAGGDPAAQAIMTAAGTEAGRSALAAIGSELVPVVARTGGLFQAGGALVAAFERTVEDGRPDADVREPLGDPLDGALLLAERVHDGRIRTHEPFVWVAR